jgi:hypothetical protein
MGIGTGELKILRNEVAERKWRESQKPADLTLPGRKKDRPQKRKGH